MTNLVMVISAFCHCATCCTVAGQPTASGAMPRVGVTVAGPRRIPFGTRIHIAGIGWRKVQDRAAMKFDDRIDVFVRNHAEAVRFGIRHKLVFIP